MIEPAIYVNWLPGVARKTTSEVMCDYKRFHGIVDDNKGQPFDVSANVADDLDDVFAHEVLWEGDGGSSFTDDDCSFITTALPRLSKRVRASRSDFANLVKHLVDELEASQAATEKTEKDAQRQKRIVLEAVKSKKNALNEIASLR